MSNAISRDGTTIAYEKTGDGPAVVLVDGALCYRDMGPARPLARLLAEHFTVYTYDRRGRGESGDTAPYAPEREGEDLAAVIEAAGGSAYVYGISSGVPLAADAATRYDGITKLALYEPPFVVDPSGNVAPPDFRERLEQLVAAGKRGDAVRAFMRLVGMPAVIAHAMRLMPAWKKLKGVAHTLPYDFRILAGTQDGTPLPRDRWEWATAPALVMAGGKSADWMRQGAQALADVLPNGEYRTIEGQNHMLKPAAVAPLLVEFWNAGQRETSRAS